MKLKFNFFCLSLAFLVLSSCENCSNDFAVGARNRAFSVGDSIYCVSYNTQTFFDAIQDGNEFREFKGAKSKWNTEKYKTRLARLREAGELSVQTLGGKKNRMPDIFILQEIESLRVIEDFSKMFSASEGYDNAVFFPIENNASFSTAIFSKFPVVEFHQFNIQDSRFDCSGLRPLIKATFEINRGKTCEYITIFAVHWKSKLGDNTELIRVAQEHLLVNQIDDTLKNNPDAYILVCGDFNQELDEFVSLNSMDNVWKFSASTHNQLGINGSYYYKKEWEAIDHIFFSKSLNNGMGLELVDFAPVAVEPLIKENGEPNKFKVYNGAGYSDHLPLCCVLQFLD